MTDLAETYFRLAIRIEDSDREKLEAILEGIARNAAQGLFSQETEISVTLREGTLKGWIKVIGGIYAAVAAYGSFRSGVDYLVHDGQKFSNAISSTIENSGIAKSEILRIEKRTSVPGKLHRALSSVEAVRELKGASRGRFLDQARVDLSYALARSTNDQDRVLIAQNIPPEIQPDLPKKLPISHDEDGRRALLRPEDVERIEHSLLRDVSKTRDIADRLSAAPKRKTSAKAERAYKVQSTRDGFLLLRR